MQPSPLSSLLQATFLLAASVCFGADRLPANAPPQRLSAFFKANCYECHQGADAEAGFDLAKLSFDLADDKVQRQWVRIFDRVQQGEMPPAEASALDPPAKAGFLQAAGDWLREYQLDQDVQFGRVRARRLTRREIERSLHDLLGIDIPLADQLPEESRSAGFTTVADGQAMSHFQLERHLAVVDVALDEAFRRALSRPDEYQRDFDAREVARRDPTAGGRASRRCCDGRAVVWSSGLIFYGRIPATTAPESGWYRFRVRAGGTEAARKRRRVDDGPQRLVRFQRPAAGLDHGFRGDARAAGDRVRSLAAQGAHAGDSAGRYDAEEGAVRRRPGRQRRRGSAERARHRHRADHDAADSSRGRRRQRPAVAVRRFDCAVREAGRNVRAGIHHASRGCGAVDRGLRPPGLPPAA